MDTPSEIGINFRCQLDFLKTKYLLEALRQGISTVVVRAIEQEFQINEPQFSKALLAKDLYYVENNRIRVSFIISRVEDITSTAHGICLTISPSTLRKFK